MRNPIAYHPSTYQMQGPPGLVAPKSGRWTPAWLTFRWELAFYVGLVLMSRW